jgi:arylsulfatase A-like enzyme
VLIFTDDQGYGDVGVYGAKGFQTPNLDRMAAEGVRFTDFYAAQAVCSASRAALLTGCYPNRIGILGALGPGAKTGIADEEWTIAEVLKTRGYATAAYGKWHLGDHPRFLPPRHGFDDYFGLPYSNDMWPHHPTARHFPELPLIEDDEVILPRIEPADQERLTTWYTKRAVKFIEDHRDEPFFVYVAHSMPHVPLYVSEKFRGKSQQGLYGDVIMEIDWSVGEILGTLERLGLDERTLVIFTCDNGPWLSYGDHAGSAGPLREGKGTTWDGGQREPCLMRWPGRIPAGTVCGELAATIDVLPTVAHVAGVEELPMPHAIDGKNIWPLMAGAAGSAGGSPSDEKTIRTPHDAYYFYWGRELQAVRSGKWKLHFPHAYRSLDGRPGGTRGRPAEYVEKRTELALYNLETDVGETSNVAAEHPEVVARLRELADRAREELGDSATGQKGNGVRPPGRLE